MFSKPSQIKRRVLTLAMSPSKNFFDLARSLATLHDVDPVLLREIETSSGIKRRRLYYLLDVGRVLRQNKISKRDAEMLGWTKLQIVARHIADRDEVNHEEMQSLMALAQATTARDLPQALRGKVFVEKTRCVALHFTEEQYVGLEEVLLAFGAEAKGRGLIGKEEAILRIAQIATNKG